VSADDGEKYKNLGKTGHHGRGLAPFQDPEKEDPVLEELFLERLSALREQLTPI